MASQYTKDITKSKVYKQATGQDTKLIDEVIQGLGVVKKFGQSKIADNITRLQEEKVFDAQNKKNQLMQLNKFGDLETDLQDNYGGDLEAFSRAKAKELLDQRALINFPVGDTEKSKLNITHPDEAYGQTLLDASRVYKENFKGLREKLNEAGIPYTADAEKQGAFIDEAYQNIFNNVSRANNFNVLKGMGSLFRGQGLNYASAEDLKKSYNENISKSKLSDIEDLNNQFKAIYHFDSNLADRISKVVDKADVRKDVKTTFGERKQRTIVDNKGQERIQNYVIMRTEYIDKEGNPQINVVEKDLGKDPFKAKLSDVPTEMLYAGFLKNIEVNGRNALDEYQALLSDGYTPRYAYEALDPEFKKSYSEIEFDNFYKSNQETILDAYQKYQEDYYMTPSPTGGFVLKQDVSNYFAGKGPKPNYVYANARDFAASLIDVKTAINKENIIGGTVAVLDYGLSSGADWQEYMNSFQGRKDILDLKDGVVSNEAFVEELKDEFKRGDRTRVDNFGNYFPTTGITGLNTQQLQEMGLGSTFKDTQQLGYNVNRDTLVMRNYGQGLPTETPPPAEETTIGDTAQAVFDFAKDFVIGEELSLDDALWLVPGAGIAVNLGRRVITKGFTTIAPRILKSKDTQKAISELNKIQNKTIQVRKTTKRKAKSGPNKGKMIEVPVKGQGPKNFKTVPSGNPQYFNFRTKGQFDTWFEGLDPLKKALVKSMKTVDNKGVVSYSKNVDIKSFSKELGNIKGSKVQLKMPGGGLTYTIGTGGAVVKSGAEFSTMEDEE